MLDAGCQNDKYDSGLKPLNCFQEFSAETGKFYFGFFTIELR
jgi:hypothetical protein